MKPALQQAHHPGGRGFVWQCCLSDRYPDAFYVEPAIVEMPEQTDVVRTETFPPILYALKYTDFDTALAMQNDVPQGLSAALFSNDLREAERFMSAAGADFGIVNTNNCTFG